VALCQSKLFVVEFNIGDYEAYGVTHQADSHWLILCVAVDMVLPWVLPGFVLGCHDLGMFWDKFWTRFGHVLANVGDTEIWLEHEKSMVKTSDVRITQFKLFFNYFSTILYYL